MRSNESESINQVCVKASTCLLKSAPPKTKSHCACAIKFIAASVQYSMDYSSSTVQYSMDYSSSTVQYSMDYSSSTSTVQYSMDYSSSTVLYSMDYR